MELRRSSYNKFWEKQNEKLTGEGRAFEEDVISSFLKGDNGSPAEMRLFFLKGLYYSNKYKNLQKTELSYSTFNLNLNLT